LDDETAMFAVYDGHGGKLVTCTVCKSYKGVSLLKNDNSLIYSPSKSFQSPVYLF